ncbi:MAG: enoyl-CoA hydratase/isomerase family protein [Rhodobacteraceae bacterium]|nr:enoyl-CoA hydratase/isomerase family protein [Paracoccaceae bacterium]
MGGRVHRAQTGSALWLTMDNPGRRNALSVALLTDLKAALNAPMQADIRIVFLRGAGGTFSAGADLADITGTERDVAYDRLTAEIGDLLRACPLPVAALIEGPCMGAAVELALSADLRIAERDACFQVPATRLGLLYKPDAIALLRARFSAETLTRLMVLGERFSAKGARRAGLVGEIVKSGDIERRARELGDLAAKTDAAAAAATKRLLVELEGGRADMAAWRERYIQLLTTDARKEAVLAIKARLGADAQGKELKKPETPDAVQ